MSKGFIEVSSVKTKSMNEKSKILKNKKKNKSKI
jgi:hypothetical protein